MWKCRAPECHVECARHSARVTTSCIDRFPVFALCFPYHYYLFVFLRTRLHPRSHLSQIRDTKRRCVAKCRRLLEESKRQASEWSTLRLSKKNVRVTIVIYAGRYVTKGEAHRDLNVTLRKTIVYGMNRIRKNNLSVKIRLGFGVCVCVCQSTVK